MFLSDIAVYVKDRVSIQEIRLVDYVTTDSLLQNKRGRICAQNLPPVVCNLTRFQKGDVLVANIRPYLKKIWFADCSGGCSSDVLVFRAKPGHCPNFLYAVLMQDSFYDFAMLGAKGSKMPRGDKEQIMRYEIPIPSIDKKREESIGNLIENIESRINLCCSINHNLEAMMDNITDYMFLSNKNSMPKRCINDIAEIKAGGDCPKEWAKSKTKEYKTPIYSNGTENEGLYGYAKEPIITQRSITVAARGTIGYCFLRDAGYIPIIRLLSVIPNEIGGDVYLHQIFNRIKFKKDGSIQQQLTIPSLASMEIPYPNATRLKDFSKIVYPIVDMIKQNKQQIEVLAKQRDELLPLLMNGQVEVVNYDLSND